MQLIWQIKAPANHQYSVNQLLGHCLHGKIRLNGYLWVAYGWTQAFSIWQLVWLATAGLAFWLLQKKRGNPTPNGLTMVDRDHWAKVWIADEKRAASIWKFFVYDDQGELRLRPNSLSFKGATRSIEIPLTEVHGIEFHRQTWAWALSASIIGVVCIIYFLHVFATGQVHSAFVPAIAIFGSLMLLGLLAYDTYSAPWIVLTCRKNGEPLRIWFAVSRSESAAGFDETMALRDAIAEAARIDARPF